MPKVRLTLRNDVGSRENSKEENTPHRGLRGSRISYSFWMNPDRFPVTLRLKLIPKPRAYRLLLMYVHSSLSYLGEDNERIGSPNRFHVIPTSFRSYRSVRNSFIPFHPVRHPWAIVHAFAAWYVSWTMKKIHTEKKNHLVNKTCAYGRRNKCLVD